MMGTVTNINELEQKFKSIDRKFGIFIIVGLFVIVLVGKYFDDNKTLEMVMAVIGLIIIAYSIYGTIAGKSKICKEIGLICPLCNCTPKAMMALSSMANDYCFKCEKRMGVFDIINDEEGKLNDD